MATKRLTTEDVVQIANLAKEPEIDLKAAAHKLRSAVAVAASRMADETDAMEVTREVIKDLNSSKREVAVKLLGLNNSWGKWEVDHCNGRKSPIGDYLDIECKELIAEWVREAVKEVLTAEYKDKFKTQIKGALKKEVAERVSRNSNMWEHGERIAQNMLSEVADELRVELGIKEPTLKANR